MATPKNDNNNDAEGLSSPPCFLHEIDPAYSGLEPDPEQERYLKQWRKSERERLIGERIAMPVSKRESVGELIARDLDALVPDTRETVVSIYWPFRGEPDLRNWMSSICGRGLRAALPIVVAKGQALKFREWTPETRMERGVWNIPIPTSDSPDIVPNVVISPLVGFDPSGYRLGYGGGFFDRTLAGLSPKPLVIGVGYKEARIPTIYPQWHDIPMTYIVTGEEPPTRS